MSLKNAKSVRRPHPLQKVQKQSQEEWGKALDAREAALVLEKSLNQAFWICSGSACADPHLCDFPENYF